MPFSLHPSLERDGIRVGRFELSLVLLINDTTYPWFVLVPEREGISDTIDLGDEDHERLWAESFQFGKGLMRAYSGDKLNVASLGNMTPQLHVHHVVRYRDDPAWPAPIWGQQTMEPYTAEGIAEVQAKLHAADMPGFHAETGA